MNRIKQLSTKVTAFTVLGLTTLQAPVYAQSPEQQLCEGAGGTFSGGKCSRPGDRGLFDEGGIFRNIINVLIFLVGVIAVIMLIIGAIRYATSGGDPNATKGAKDTILFAIIGIVVAAAAFALVNFVINSLTS